MCKNLKTLNDKVVFDINYKNVNDHRANINCTHLQSKSNISG